MPKFAYPVPASGVIMVAFLFLSIVAFNFNSLCLEDLQVNIRTPFITFPAPPTLSSITPTNIISLSINPAY